MPELGTRWSCPVCLGAKLNKVRVGVQATVEIDHCWRCGGVWLEHGEIPRLRANPPAALWTAIARRTAKAVFPCHSCHARFDRNLDACPACGSKNVIDCPVCDRPMRRELMGGIHLDVCRSCKGVWFDHHELDEVWKTQAGLALERRRETARLARVGEEAGDMLLATLWYSPDLAVYGAYGAAQAASHAASGLVHAAGHIPDLVAAAPETAVHVVAAAGEAAGSVFDVIVHILEWIFGLFDF
jgi:Zn-finger nucleic acid-binding protein